MSLTRSPEYVGRHNCDYSLIIGYTSIWPYNEMSKFVHKPSRLFGISDYSAFVHSNLDCYLCLEVWSDVVKRNGQVTPFKFNSHTFEKFLFLGFRGSEIMCITGYKTFYWQEWLKADFQNKNRNRKRLIEKLFGEIWGRLFGTYCAFNWRLLLQTMEQS